MSPVRWYQRPGAWDAALRPSLLLPSERQRSRVLVFHYILVAAGLSIEGLRRLFRGDWKRPAPKNILFVSRYHLGDFLMSVPGLMLAQSSATRGTADTSVVLQRRYIGQIDLRGIAHAAIGEADETQSFWNQVKFWLRRFREERYDAVVFHRITRPDFPSVFAAFLSSIPYRVGGADKGVSGLLTDLYSPADREHVVDYHLNLIRGWLEIPPGSEGKSWPPLVDQPSAVDRYDVVIAPFAQHSKIWTPESWRDLLARLTARGLRIALSATPAFAKSSAEILEGFPNVVDLSETTGTLADLFATVRRTSLLIAVDTGIRHVAAAVGTPCVTLGQGREHLTILGQYVPTERYLMHDVPCAPCGAEPCPLGHLLCIRGITVDEVIRAIEELAPNFPDNIHRQP